MRGYPNMPKGSAVLIVLIPCAKQLGHNLMVAFDWEAAQGFRHTYRE